MISINIKTVATVALIYLGVNFTDNLLDSIKKKVINSKLPFDVIGLVSILYGQRKDNDDEKGSLLKERLITLAKNEIGRKAQEYKPDFDWSKINLEPDRLMPIIFGDDNPLDDAILGASAEHIADRYSQETEITAKYSTAVWCQLPDSVGEYQMEGSKLLVSQITGVDGDFGDMFGFVLNGKPYKAQVGHWVIPV